MKFKSQGWSIMMLLGMAILCRASETPSAARVETFSPAGYVREVRQVSVRFATPMVALGDPRLPDPFKIDCPATGKGRWADQRNWVFDFDADLPAGVSCHFSLSARLKALDGSSLEGPVNFDFHTGGPAIVSSLPYEGSRDIDEHQIFLVKLDAPADLASIRAHAYCVVEGVGEQIPLEILEGEARAAVLRQRKALGYDYLQLLWKNGEVSDIRVRNRNMERQDALILALRCRRALPPATQVRLSWGAGIASLSGISTRSEQQLAFRVRDAFMAQVDCTRQNARAGCIPVLPIVVNFSAPVPRALALGVRLKATQGFSAAPTAAGDDKIPTLESVSFGGPFPPSSELSVALPPGLEDDAGRPLLNAARFPLPIRIDNYPPLAKFSGEFGILEAREGGILPVTLRNLEPKLAARVSSIDGKALTLGADGPAIAAWLKRVEISQMPNGAWVEVNSGDPAHPKPSREWRETTGSHSVFEDSNAAAPLTVPAASSGKAAQVVGIPLKKTGFYVVELQSRVLGSALLAQDIPRYVATSALVTNLSVHFKWGRESSRVWVTQLSDGRTVEGARVVVSDYCGGATLWQGKTDQDGIAIISQSLGDPHAFASCFSYSPHPLMVLAAKDADFSFTLSSWSQGIAPHQFSLPVGHGSETLIAHTVLDRALFRAGETLSMKHFLRRHVSAGIEVPASAPGSHRIIIAHEGSDGDFSEQLLFDAAGEASGEWKIPSDAKLGMYTVRIDEELSAQFRVEQFRLPSLHAEVSGAPQPLVDAREAALDVHVAYLSGGGASGLPVKLRTLIEPQAQHFTDFADYQFGGEPLQEGISSSGGTPNDEDFEEEPRSEPTKTQITPATLDGSGSARITLKNLPILTQPALLTAELEYADANGEILTSTGHVRLLPAALAVGVRTDGWVASPGKMKFRVVVLDLDGKPQPQTRVQASLYQSNTYSYRKRLIGGFYAYESSREIKKLTTACAGRTDDHGLLFCEIAPGVSGQILVRAEAQDAQGRPAGSTAEMWVAGPEEWWFGGTSGDRMDVLPEKKEYEAGDRARFQVRMPFRAATALVTVEREGVLSSFVTRLQGSAPVIELPIEPGYSPNVFVSVLAVRGRVPHAESSGKKVPADDETTALVDLNKPAYRLGEAQIKVGWRPHRLKVQVEPAHPTYPVRGQAQVQIHVSAEDGRALPAGTEIAVAAVDDALLDLAPNPSWDLLAAMMGERGLEVWTSTAQMQVVGKRHYGRKAVTHGGGGGRERDRARELFDSLLYWKSTLRLDAHGNAEVLIPMNDSLSSFRIVAIASGGAQLFGSGSARIRTTQDLILMSGLPPVVREADRYAATFTVRNTTDHAMNVQLNAVVSPRSAPLATQTVDLAAGQSRDVSWQLSAPFNADKLSWDVVALETTGPGRDHLKVAESVTPAFPVRTYQATIAQLTGPLAWPAARPLGAIPGRGGLEVTLQAKLGDSLDGVREYLSRYPYICFEQLTSRSIGLNDRAGFDRLMQRLPTYMDGDGLIKYFPVEWLQGEDTLTAYVLSIAQEADWTLPEAERDRLLRALSGFVEGKIVRGSALPTADLSVRKIAAIAALSRYQAAHPQMLESLRIEPNLWPTSALLDWIDILKRLPGIPDKDEKLRAAFGILRARLNFQGTVMGFSTERGDALWWLMISTDSNANRMLLAALDQPDWRADIPRLVRGSLSRQQRGHWNTTVANAWGALAMQKFSAAFESAPVSGASIMRYQGAERPVTWPQASGAAQIALPWAPGASSLQITHEGSGAPWAMLRATAALPLDKPLFTGYQVKRTVSAVEQRTPGLWSRGDVARVHLDIDAQSDMTWVAIDDPIPAGATIMGGGLGGRSALLSREDSSSGWAWMAFDERTFQAYHAYYRFVPKGRFTLEYTVRFNNPGTFILPATRVEAMYAPEMFGELPNAKITVKAE